MTGVLALTLIAATPAPAATKHGPRPHHSRGYLTAVQLNRMLARTPMRGTGWGLVNAGKHWNVHPAFIAAIAGTESSFGAAACSNNRYNAFGLSSCGYGWRVPSFRSWRESYEFMARFLATRWPWHRTPYDFRGYAACSECWGRKTASWMRWLGFGSSTRWD